MEHRRVGGNYKKQSIFSRIGLGNKRSTTRNKRVGEVTRRSLPI